MPINKGTYAISKSAAKALKSNNKRKKEQEQKDQRDKRLAEQALRKGVRFVVDAIWPKNGFGDHHCGHKDAGTSHAISRECFSKEHMGICRVCLRPAAARTGCTNKKCRETGRARDLWFEGFSFPGNV